MANQPTQPRGPPGFYFAGLKGSQVFISPDHMGPPLFLGWVRGYVGGWLTSHDCLYCLQD